jgi:hypothetical protein
MSRIVDNLIAFRILSMLVKPFAETDAFRLGIIDGTGKNLKKSSDLKTTEEKDAYTYLHRLVFNMKKILNKLPGNENKTKSLVAALYLVKEYYQQSDRTVSMMEERYIKILDTVNKNVTLAEEQIIVDAFMNEEGGAPVNSTAGASVNEPKIEKKDIKKYQNLARRKPTDATQIKTT